MVEQSQETKKAQDRIDYTLKSVKDLSTEISQYNEEELEELENRTRAEIRRVKKNIDLVKVLGGKAISEKGYNVISNHDELLKTKTKDLMEFKRTSDIVYDSKGKQVEKVTYLDEGHKYWREVSVVPDEYKAEHKQAKITHNKLDIREHNTKIHLKYLQSIIEAIGKVNKERLAPVLEAELAAIEVKDKEEKLKNLRISELGRLLMKSNPIQKIPPKK
jgi:hypothetical protein